MVIGPRFWVAGTPHRMREGTVIINPIADDGWTQDRTCKFEQAPTSFRQSVGFEAEVNLCRVNSRVKEGQRARTPHLNWRIS